MGGAGIWGPTHTRPAAPGPSPPKALAGKRAEGGLACCLTHSTDEVRRLQQRLAPLPVLFWPAQRKGGRQVLPPTINTHARPIRESAGGLVPEITKILLEPDEVHIWIMRESWGWSHAPMCTSFVCNAASLHWLVERRGLPAAALSVADGTRPAGGGPGVPAAVLAESAAPCRCTHAPGRGRPAPG